MKKLLTLLSVSALLNLFSAAAFAADAPPSIPDPFALEQADDAPPTLQLDSGTSTSSSSSSGSSGSYVKPSTTSTTTTTKNTIPTTQPAPSADDPDREISGTGPEMIYLILLGLLLIGGYQFAMKRK